MMPFQFRIYFRTLWDSLFLKAPWTLPRVGIFLFFSIFYPLGEMFNALTLLLDNVFFPGYRKIQVRNPVFIVGNARSGTTYMHRLMAMDKEHFNSFKLSDLIMISVGLKKFFGLIGKIDRALGGHLASGMDKLQARLFREADKIHKLRLSHPEEDEGVMVHCWASAFLTLMFPVPVANKWERFDELPEHERRKLMKFFKSCVQRQLYCNGGDAVQLLSKNPLFSNKIASIFETFPDARIVYMARTPYETVASVHNMVDKIWNIQLQLPKDAQPREALTQMCINSYRHALSELDKHDQAQSIIVSYEDLVHEPKKTVEGIYAKFGFPISDTYRQVLTKTTEKSRGYKSEHQYSLEQFGLTKERVYRETRDVFERFGFDKDGEFSHDPDVAGKNVQVA